MPPGPVYNLLCVASSVADILGHAARIRASQLESTAAPVTAAFGRSTRKRESRAPLDSPPTRQDLTLSSTAQPGPSVYQSVTQASSVLPADSSNSIVQHAPPLEPKTASSAKEGSSVPLVVEGRRDTAGLLPSQYVSKSSNPIRTDAPSLDQLSRQPPDAAPSNVVEHEAKNVGEGALHVIPTFQIEPKVDSISPIEDAKAAMGSDVQVDAAVLPDLISPVSRSSITPAALFTPYASIPILMLEICACSPLHLIPRSPGSYSHPRFLHPE
ncbi:hypothetical protein OBBRIDRAFT_355232 [Obba rivulosa]|uniref:Uncharacterized protein n=1 Tax=Obba rivulosa TaxID=1052685 RepID=A0A8E2AI70_9APHY|nr:hypothetical protein OBBRIDRAFT_355232 [Obba rivulosa]